MSDTLPSDPDELREMIAALTAENARMTVEVERMTATLRAQDLLVQALQARIAKLQRQRFGPSSEKIEREIAQLKLALEDLQVALAEGDAIPIAAVDGLGKGVKQGRVWAYERGEAVGGRGTPRRGLLLLAGPAGRASASASEEQRRHPASRRL